MTSFHVTNRMNSYFRPEILSSRILKEKDKPNFMVTINIKVDFMRGATKSSRTRQEIENRPVKMG